MTDASAKTIALQSVDRGQQRSYIITGCASAEAAAGYVAPHLRLRYRIRNYLREAVLTFWRRHLYRHVMRFMHRFNWHYAPPSNLHHLGQPRTLERHHWCQWCGLRGTTIDYETTPTLQRDHIQG